MKKIKIYGSLVMSMLSIFIIGAYADSTLNQVKEIELYQWVFTSLFGLFFLINFLIEYKKS